MFDLAYAYEFKNNINNIVINNFVFFIILTG